MPKNVNDELPYDFPTEEEVMRANEEMIRREAEEQRNRQNRPVMNIPDVPDVDEDDLDMIDDAEIDDEMDRLIIEEAGHLNDPPARERLFIGTDSHDLHPRHPQKPNEPSKEVEIDPPKKDR